MSDEIEGAKGFVPKERRRRRNLQGSGREEKLAFEKKEGMHRRWVKDTPGRMQQMREMDYTAVRGVEPVYGGVNKDGTPFNLRLMETRKDWYDEAQQARAADIDRSEEQIRGAQGEHGLQDKRSQYGSINIERG